jgi:hypothetical protein
MIIFLLNNFLDQNPRFFLRNLQKLSTKPYTSVEIPAQSFSSWMSIVIGSHSRQAIESG